MRLDRINSAQVIRLARDVYFRFLAQGTGRLEPLGVVIEAAGPGGRVVFDRPVLLPDEQFVPLDWLQVRTGDRTRSSRPPRANGPRSGTG